MSSSSLTRRSPVFRDGQAASGAAAPGTPAGRRSVGAAIADACVVGAALPLLAAARLLASLASPLVHRLLLALLVLDIPFRLETNLAYRLDLERFGGIGGFNVSLTTVVLAMLYLRWALHAVVARSQPREQAVVARGSRALMLYVAFATLSTLLAMDVDAAVRELFLLVQVFLIYVYLVRWLSVRDVRFIVWCFVVAAAFQSLVMFYGSHVGETLTVATRRIRVDEAGGRVRVAGTVGSPNSAAAYLALLIAPMLALLLTPATRWQKFGAVLTAVLASLALVATGSRGGWLAVLLSLALLWLASVRYLRRPLLIPVAAIALAGAILAGSGGTIVTRLSSDDRGSALSRWPLMQTAVKMIRDHPVLGVGPNNYSLVMGDYEAVSGDWGNFVFVVHNKFLLVWAETGLGGFISFVCFVAAAIRLGWRAWLARHPWLSPLALGFTTALVGHVVHMQVDLFSDRPMVEMLWVIAAIVAVIEAGTRAERYARARASAPAPVIDAAITP